MTVEMGNLWTCDHCKSTQFIARTSQIVLPPGWFNVESDGGRQIVTCSAVCLAGIAAKETPKKNSP